MYFPQYATCAFLTFICKLAYWIKISQLKCEVLRDIRTKQWWDHATLQKNWDYIEVVT